MNDTLVIETKLSRLEKEMHSIKQLLQAILAKVERNDRAQAAQQARKDAGALMQSVAARKNLSPEAAEALAHEAVEETRAHTPGL